jgi:hypothetical protein
LPSPAASARCRLIATPVAAGWAAPYRSEGAVPAQAAAGAPAETTVVDDCRNHDVDIPSALLTGAVTINGVAAEPDPKARFLMRSGPNDLVEIPFTGDSYAVRVAPGTYDLFFAATGPTLATPANQLALLHAGVTVAPTGTTTLDIDVRSTTVAGTITVNGAPLAEGDAVSLSLPQRGRRHRPDRDCQQRRIQRARDARDRSTFSSRRTPRPRAARRRRTSSRNWRRA